jgi:demethylmacrocin O-methyltransferase
MPLYQAHFRHLRKRKLTILEIGVGGHDLPDEGGASLRIWKYYFINSMIYSIDIHDKSSLQEKRITIFKGNQANEGQMRDIAAKIGPLDIVIDDGSHMNEHTIASFKYLFPSLREGGIYVVEDTQTSYWKEYGGDSQDLNNPSTTMNFFKGLVDCLNYEEFRRPEYKPTYFDQHITALYFYHNLIFVYKGAKNKKA